MTDGFEVDADRLSGQAGQFDGLVSRVGAIQRQLSDALSATGRCWGADTVGESFDAVHAGPAEDTATRLASLPDKIGSVGTRFAATAGTYTDTDDAGVERLNGV